MKISHLIAELSSDEMEERMPVQICKIYETNEEIG